MKAKEVEETNKIAALSKDKKKWVAQITFQRKNHLIGRFSTKREARGAFCWAKK